MNKKLKLDQIVIADKAFRLFGFYKHWNFMSAMPGNLEDVGHTLWLVSQLAKTSMSSFTRLHLGSIYLYGTVMYKQAIDEFNFKEPKKSWKVEGRFQIPT